MHKPNLAYDANDWHSALLTAKDISKTGYTAWMIDNGGFFLWSLAINLFQKRPNTTNNQKDYR